MPELPDLTVYLERLQALVGGQPCAGLRLASPFLLRTVEPPPGAFAGRRLEGLSRIGKRLVLSFDGDLHAVLHLMIAGRLRWRPAGAAIPGKIGLAALDFAPGTVLLTEASTQKRAALHLLAGRDALGTFERGGLEVPGSAPEAFAAAMVRGGHTLKRALTDPRILSGVGNAYSDEILHRARLSPFKLARSLSGEEMARLHVAAVATLAEWTDRLRAEAGDGLPERVTAFRGEMAVHGRFRKPCPVCGAPVQRIRYASNECNYCPGCQTGGRVLADRSLSRLLKGDWPRRLEELEDGGPLGLARRQDT